MPCLSLLRSSGAQNPRGRGFVTTYNGSAIEAYVIDGARQWRVQFPYDLGQNWLNFALTWSSTNGLAIFIDGTVQGNSSHSIPL